MNAIGHQTSLVSRPRQCRRSLSRLAPIVIGSFPLHHIIAEHRSGSPRLSHRGERNIAAVNQSLLGFYEYHSRVPSMVCEEGRARLQEE